MLLPSPLERSHYSMQLL